MNTIEKISQEYLKSLYTEDCLFKVIPNDIGKVVYCGTTNSDKEGYSKKEKIKRIFISLFICVFIPFLFFLLFENALIFNIFVSIICLFVFIWYYIKISNFNGVDYFVGEKGFSILKFENSRDNIIENRTILFENMSQLLTGETYKKVNFSYTGTDYFFLFLSHPKEEFFVDVLYEVEDVYNQEKPEDEIHEDEYLFFKQVEAQWCMYLYNKLILQQETSIVFNVIIHNKDKEQWESMPYITFENKKILVGGRVYDSSTIKNIYFKNGTLVIEHINHSKKWFGLKETGNIENIPLTNIGNKKLFLLLLDKFLSEKNK